MSALKVIELELRKLGYKAEGLIRDYTFANVFSEAGEIQRVDLAAFTQVPESYRSAAFGVISGVADEGEISGRRALGAPILLAIGPDDVGVWRVGVEGWTDRVTGQMLQIDENDLWIAAQAVERNLVILTSDRDFTQIIAPAVPELRVILV